MIPTDKEHNICEFMWVCMDRNLGTSVLISYIKLGNFGIWGSSPDSDGFPKSFTKIIQTGESTLEQFEILSLNLSVF